MLLGTLGAIGHGIAVPCVIIVFGDMLNIFLDTEDICDVCNNITDMIDKFNDQNSGEDFTCDTFFKGTSESETLTE